MLEPDRSGRNRMQRRQRMHRDRFVPRRHVHRLKPGDLQSVRRLPHRGELRFIDEPFHPGRLAITRGFRPRQYIRPDDDDPAYLDPARAIVTGRVRSLWTDRYNRRPFPVRRLVKEVRGNLLLPWLHARFPGMPMALMSGWIAADALDRDLTKNSFRARSAPLEEVRP